MRISEIVAAPGAGTYSNDDQAAIAAGATRDGYFYDGAVLTPGYRSIRQPSESLQVLLVLDDDHVVAGAGVSVQYAGGSGREPVLRATAARDRWLPVLDDLLRGATLDSFRATSALVGTLGLPRSIAYGVSQALLEGAAHATRRTMAEVVAAEYGNTAPIGPVPILAQCGEDRHAAIDRMVLRGVESLPHGLINNADQLVGPGGRLLLDYAGWVRDRVVARRLDTAYEPVIHLDCYGTLGDVFSSTAQVAGFLAELADRCAPLALRIEQPVRARSREAQIDVLRSLRTLLAGSGARVQLVADEWCNTHEDVLAFLDADAADMIQIKMPDVGSIDDTVRSVLACHAAGVAAYCGGSCTETDLSARVATHVAMGAGADLLLARPGMGVDEAVMVTRNEMARTLAIIEHRSGRDRSQ
ncbi:methylaspartate ammonia-lyase [Jiangella muralis]|uniref:methylaspartate ammonia-lyase n=1 Tax=Jiangella muralis TaxID=702383 RepID=UPI00069FBA80|nr:methylaspartate ammonia-lyase [Jiangella muralis]